MSYDISLYEKDFYKRAISQSRGDWTNAPALPQAVLKAIRSDAVRLGFQTDSPDFYDGEALLLEGSGDEDDDYDDEYGDDDDDVHFDPVAMLTLSTNHVSLTIPYGDEAEDTVDRCLKMARTWADTHGLALHDPQDGGDD